MSDLSISAPVLSTLCYISKGDKTLMLNRNKKINDIHKGKWNGLGGKFEQGESPEQCVVREVKEESGLDIVNPVLKGFISFPSFKEGSNGQWQDWYVFIYVAKQSSGNLIDSDEGTLQWIENTKLLDLPLWEGDKIFIPWLSQEKFFSAKFVYLDKKLKEHTVQFY